MNFIASGSCGGKLRSNAHHITNSIVSSLEPFQSRIDSSFLSYRRPEDDQRQ